MLLWLRKIKYVNNFTVICLHMAHEDLPKEIHKIFSAKLEHQDVASLEADIFTRAQLILEQLEACVGLNHCAFSV